jgi:hypothetical protein
MHPTTATIKRAVRKAEVASGTGATGYTLLKMKAAPLARLIADHKIGPVETRAADEISMAFFALSGGLMFRPQSWERRDPSYDTPLPQMVEQAISNYKTFANHWSMKAKQGDRTLEVVIACLIDERAFSAIEADLGIRHGLAAKALARGLRDYAARVGWVERKTEAIWKAEAGMTFSPHRRALALAIQKARVAV